MITTAIIISPKYRTPPINTCGNTSTLAVNHAFFLLSPVAKDAQSCLVHASDAKVSLLLHRALGYFCQCHTLWGAHSTQCHWLSHPSVHINTDLEDFTLLFFVATLKTSFYWTMKEIIPSNRILRLLQWLYSLLYSLAGVALLAMGGGADRDSEHSTVDILGHSLPLFAWNGHKMYSFISNYTTLTWVITYIHVCEGKHIL